MMKGVFFALAVLGAVLGLLLVPVAAQAADGGGDTLRVLTPATLPTPKGVNATGVYVVVDNPSMETDTLLSASSPQASSAQLSGTLVQGGQVTTFPVDTVTILPASTTVLGPGTSFIRLKGLKKPLVEGDTVPLTLVFAKAGPLATRVQVLSGTDLVRQYPVESTVLTIKRVGGQGAAGILP